MKLRRFTNEGMVAFRQYLIDLRANPDRSIPHDLLSSPTLTEVLHPEVTAAVPYFSTRQEFAAWLDFAFQTAGCEPPMLDREFWSWLTAALFDQVCPADSRGHRKPGALARYIPEMNQWRRRYRHLLANPYHAFRVHRSDPSRAAVVLVNPLHAPGELTEQFTSRLEVISCPATIGLATMLFIDGSTGRRRAGASGEAARRLGKLINQYSRTWDIRSVELDQFVRILPREFDRFKPAAPRTPA